MSKSQPPSGLSLLTLVEKVLTGLLRAKGGLALTLRCHIIVSSPVFNILFLIFAGILVSR